MEKTEKKQRSGAFEKRIHEIDLFRGLLMCLVILDHLFNLLMSYNYTWFKATGDVFYKEMHAFFLGYWTLPLRTIVRYVVLALFCFVSGVSSAFSKNNKKRAFLMMGLWFIILVVSNVLEIVHQAVGFNAGINTFRVDFNIIGVMAWSAMIYCFFKNKSWKWLLSAAIVGLLLHVGAQLLLAADPTVVDRIYMPLLWRPSYTLAYQADHVPLVPYISFFFLGALLSSFTYAKSKKSYLPRFEIERPICFIGRHSLIIYGTHFLLLIGIFALINAIFF